MSIHTIVCAGGKRLQVKPSPTSEGCVLVQILSADRQVQASVTVDAATAGVVSQAFELEAASAADSAKKWALKAAAYQAQRAAGVPGHLIDVSGVSA